MGTGPIEELDAVAAIGLLQRGALTAEALVRACLDRIGRDEPQIHAWAWLDPDQALATARALDAGPRRPPLHGLPVGIKDIIDTADAPTECGTPLYRGRRPRKDAACVAALRAAGAVVLGKTVTTELAFFAPGPTRNPRNPAHTPGGSSSGSAAAVADCMVPAALGTQTAGSIIRPAAYCGVVGFKPSHDLLSLEGVHPFAPSLDTLGVLVRTVADVAPLLTALGAPVEFRQLSRPPRIGLWRSAHWPRATPAMQRRLEEVAAALTGRGHRPGRGCAPGRGGARRRPGAGHGGRGGPLVRGAAPERGTGAQPAAQRAPRPRRRSKSRRCPCGEGPGGSSVDCSDEGSRRPGRAAHPQRAWRGPRGLGSTGDPVFNRIVTMLGFPCINLPAGTGPSGLPLCSWSGAAR
jgi:Asp-tRNA(Asn)/Glu-tRNA(Gln) amidotransferase A subunit family amidase